MEEMQSNIVYGPRIQTRRFVREKCLNCKKYIKCHSLDHFKTRMKVQKSVSSLSSEYYLEVFATDYYDCEVTFSEKHYFICEAFEDIPQEGLKDQL